MKSPTKTQLKKKLWPIFATYIKNRDNWTCVTCGRQARGQGMNAGHYIAKAACGADYYFSEQNVHAQCAYCNLALEGNRPAYRAFILQRYGEEVLRDLETNYRKPCPDYDYAGQIEHYKLINSENVQDGDLVVE
jgi:hypothetical protein